MPVGGPVGGSGKGRREVEGRGRSGGKERESGSRAVVELTR